MTRSCAWRSPTRSTTRARSCVTTVRKGTVCGSGSHRPRDQLWYHGGLLAFFQQLRPGALTEDLWRAVGERAWLVARNDATRLDPRRVWLDADLHNGQASIGWIQPRSAAVAIKLLEEFTMHELSLAPAPQAEQVIDWLIEQEQTDREPWPTERVLFHGNDADSALAQFVHAIERRSRVAS